jgi:quinolinate synthase
MDNIELIGKIKKLKKEKNAIILGHYYQIDEIQQLSDYIGDSLALAEQSRKVDCDIIVFCGVHFMAETAKILNPSKKVLLPDISASCSLADSCPASEFAKFKAKYPDHIVISYINCSAEIKALSDIICTSGNAEKLVGSLPKDEKIIFAPDRNLGGYINRITGRNMVLWNGACEVHDALTADTILRYKQQYPEAKVIAHPECNDTVLQVVDFVGSTNAMLKYVKNIDVKQIIVATETGIVYQMQIENPNKEFIIVSNSGCNCNDCRHMKMNTLEKLYSCLATEKPEIIMNSELIEKAKAPIIRMLEISKSLNLI